MKILQVITSLATGGAERLVYDLSIELNKSNKVEVVTLFNCKNELFYKKLKEENIKIYNLGKRTGFDSRCLIRLIQLVTRSNYDIIHCHLGSLLYVSVLALFYKKKVVYTIHNIAEKDAPPKYKWLYKFLFEKSYVIPVSICKKVKKSSIEFYGNFMKNCDIIYNGINTKLIEDAPIISKYKENSEIKYISVASFKEQKNHLFLMDLFEQILKKYPNSTLYLAGEGELKNRISSYIIEKNMKNQVIFLGNRDDVYSLMKSMDVFILTSKWEGFSIAILEAMAAGMKIIVSDVGGNAEQIRHLESGIVFKLDNLEEATQGIELLLNSDNFGDMAVQTVKDKFSIEKTAQQYLKLFQALVNNIEKK